MPTSKWKEGNHVAPFFCGGCLADEYQLLNCECDWAILTKENESSHGKTLSNPPRAAAVMVRRSCDTASRWLSAAHSSNYAPLFGQLLAPLVNGIRVEGPFHPEWLNGTPANLVILDGEGLGHTPKSVAAISTSVIRRIEEADAVVLVDNAAQPMQAAPVAAMRELVTTGNASKLLIAFTHFDAVKGDNLATVSARIHHVLESAENVLAAVGEELGPFAERALRKRLANARFFLENIQEPLSVKTKSGTRTISQLLALRSVGGLRRGGRTNTTRS